MRSRSVLTVLLATLLSTVLAACSSSGGNGSSGRSSSRSGGRHQRGSCGHRGEVLQQVLVAQRAQQAHQ